MKLRKSQLNIIEIAAQWGGPEAAERKRLECEETIRYEQEVMAAGRAAWRNFPKTITIHLKTDSTWPWLLFGPTTIRFDRRPISRNFPSPSYRATGIDDRGQEREASPAEISVVAGHDFFQNDSQAISADTLTKWLNREINDHEAACGLAPIND